MRKKLFRYLFGLGLLCIVLAAVITSTIYFFTWKDGFIANLKEEAHMISAYSQTQALTEPLLSQLVKETKHELRLTVVDRQGNILYESDFASRRMENHKDRPEIVAAFRDGSGFAERNSQTLKEANYYYAVRSLDGNYVIRVARVGANIYHYIATALGIVFGLSLALIVAIYFLAQTGTKHFLAPFERAIFEWTKNDNPELLTRLRTDYHEINPLLSMLERQQEEIRHFVLALEDERNTLQYIITHIDEGILLLKEDGTVALCNSHMRNLFHIPHDTPLENISVRTFSHKERWLHHIQAGLVGKEHSQYEATLDHRRYRITMNSVKENDVRTGLLIIAFDITKDYEESRRRAEFSTNIAHELKTPLTTVSGYAELLDNHMFADKNEAAALGQRIYKASQQMLQLIESMLYLSDVKNRAECKALMRIEAKPLIKSAWQQLEEKWRNKEISFSVNGPDNLFITGDYHLLLELFLNLLDNAIKFGHHQNEITVSLAEKDEQVQITVQDKGCGIPAQKAERVFERFYRADESRNQTSVPGSGIGLSLVKQIVAVHHGEVTLESKEHVGTTVTILLPAVR